MTVTDQMQIYAAAAVTTNALGYYVTDVAMQHMTAVITLLQSIGV